MNRIPLVIDCDPGTDDALAILMICAAKNLEVKALTTVAGNLNIAKTTGNALKISDFFRLDLEIAAGAYPLMKKFEPCDVSIQGEGGLGDAVLPETSLNPSSISAVDLLYQKAMEPGEKLHILATGPLSNIALLLCTYPDVRERIACITLMGGAISGGNATPCSEFNIYTDPDAAKIVFQSGVPITMIGLDVSYKTPIYEKELEKFVQIPGRASEFTGRLMGYPPPPEKSIPAEGIVMFDALAAAAVINPSVMEYRHCYVDVETRGEFTTGKTVVDINGLLKKSPNTQVAVGCDRMKFLQMLEDTLRYYRED